MKKAKSFYQELEKKSKKSLVKIFVTIFLGSLGLGLFLGQGFQRLKTASLINRQNEQKLMEKQKLNSLFEKFSEEEIPNSKTNQ